MVDGWNVTVLDPGSPGKYKISFEWEHVHEKAVTLGTANAQQDPRCDGSSNQVSDIDGLPYWMPRFIPRAVPAEVTAMTGIRFVSVDWQPCGHKDITICHAESHYDIHLYYVDEADLAAMPMCTIGSQNNPNLPICRDSATEAANHDYFRLINGSIPVSMSTTTNSGSQATQQVDFCVDPDSAILRSGVHYGDKDETLQEWKSPVTIIGSHDCELKFFEPMVSWKWISGNVLQSTWPSYRVSDIEYADKSAFPAIPTGWEFEVSSGCRANSVWLPPSGQCEIRLVIEGDACQGTDPCTPVGVKQCGNMPDCLTDLPYATPWIEPTETITTVTTLSATTMTMSRTATSTSITLSRLTSASTSRSTATSSTTETSVVTSGPTTHTRVTAAISHTTATMDTTYTTTSAAQPAGVSYASITGNLEIQADDATEQQVVLISKAALANAFRVDESQISLTVDHLSGRRLAGNWMVSYSIAVSEQQASLVDSFDSSQVAATFEEKFADIGVDAHVISISEPSVIASHGVQPGETSSDEAEADSFIVVAIITCTCALMLCFFLLACWCKGQHRQRVRQDEVAWTWTSRYAVSKTPQIPEA
jgi:hypothetical protein